MKRIYTKKMHMYRLGQILNMQKPCNHCPASSKYKPDESPGELWVYSNKNYRPEPCIVCWRFIKPELTPREVDKLSCPCTSLGARKALRLTKKAFEREKEKAKI